MRRTVAVVVLAVCVVACVALLSSQKEKTPGSVSPTPVNAGSSQSGLQKGDVAGEIEKLRAQIKENPKDASLHEQLSVVLICTGANTEALAELETAITLDPKDPWYHYRKADLLKRMGKQKEALPAALHASDLGRTTLRDKEALHVIALLAGQLLEAESQWDKAEDQYELTLAATYAFASDRVAMNTDANGLAENIQSQVEKGLTAVRGHLISSRPTAEWVEKHLPPGFVIHEPVPKTTADDCKALEARILRGDYGGEGAFLELASCNIKLRRYDKAAIVSLAGTLSAPKSGMSWFNLAHSYMMDGRLSDAEKAFEKAGIYGMEGMDIWASDVRKMVALHAKKSGKSP